MEEGAENPSEPQGPTLRETGRQRTASPLRRRRNADLDIAAQGIPDGRVAWEAALSAEARRQTQERQASDSMHRVAIQGLIDRQDTADAILDSRFNRTETTLANLSNAIMTIQSLLQSQIQATTVASGAGGTGGNTGTSNLPNPAPPPSVGVPHATQPQSANIQATQGVQVATATTGPQVGGGQVSGPAAMAGVNSANLQPPNVAAPQANPPVATTTIGAVAAASTTHAVTSGGTPVVISGAALASKDIKMPALPLLGKPPNALPYVKWNKAVKIKLKAVGVKAVVDSQWTPGTPEEVQWWDHVNSLVFAALYDAVTKYETLSDNIARYCDEPNSGRLAWAAIKAYHVRLAEGNRESLLLNVNSLLPGERESMESYLCRCNNLREEFQEYNLTLDDSLLISHIFSNLDPTWRWMSGFSERPTDTLAWEIVSQALQMQDNRRRQGTKQNPMILPLGWVSRELYNKPKDAAAHSAQGVNSGAANAAIGGNHQHPKYSKSGPSAHTSGTPGQKPSFFVCFCCLEFGHGSDKCPTRAPGWKVTPQIRAKAMSLRDKKMEEYGRAKAAEGVPNPSVL